MLQRHTVSLVRCILSSRARIMHRHAGLLLVGGCRGTGVGSLPGVRNRAVAGGKQEIVRGRARGTAATFVSTVAQCELPRHRVFWRPRRADGRERGSLRMARLQPRRVDGDQRDERRFTRCDTPILVPDSRFARFEPGQACRSRQAYRGAPPPVLSRSTLCWSAPWHQRDVVQYGCAHAHTNTASN